jgi:hypothetical protein
MEINYWWVTLAFIGAFLLVYWLIRRNRKDEKDFEQDLMQSEIKPEEPTQDPLI